MGNPRTLPKETVESGVEEEAEQEREREKERRERERREKREQWRGPSELMQPHSGLGSLSFNCNFHFLLHFFFFALTHLITLSLLFYLFLCSSFYSKCQISSVSAAIHFSGEFQICATLRLTPISPRFSR